MWTGAEPYRSSTRVAGIARSDAFFGSGVSLYDDLSFSWSELTCASVTWLDAPMRESRHRGSGVDMMQSRFTQWLRQVTRRVRQGQGLVEYALLLVLITIASIAMLSALGSSISVLYSAANVMTAP